MKIKAVKLYDHGFITEPMLMGGEEGEGAFDSSVRYRQSLQNYLIDTGSEVILVDTGMPAGTPEAAPDPAAKIYLGKKVSEYVPALKALGYSPDQVSKILVTHHHIDHTGELQSFPKAKIYISPEDADTLKLTGGNIIRAAYTDGPFCNFKAHQKIADGVYYIKAQGHTRGNSIVIVEDNGLFYMIHGDVTYSDEALYRNKLSIIYDDKAAARDTLNQVREFISSHPTVYCSTHTPLGYENLEARRVTDLSNPPAVIPPEPIEAGTQEASGRYVCQICNYCYDPQKGDPDQGIEPGTPFEDLPENWHCPRCGRSKDSFARA